MEFHTYDDMRYAIRKLDGSRFENVFDRGFSIRVREEGDGYDSRSRYGIPTLNLFDGVYCL